MLSRTGSSSSSCNLLADFRPLDLDLPEFPRGFFEGAFEFEWRLDEDEWCLLKRFVIRLPDDDDCCEEDSDNGDTLVSKVLASDAAVLLTRLWGAPEALSLERRLPPPGRGWALGNGDRLESDSESVWSPDWDSRSDANRWSSSCREKKKQIQKDKLSVKKDRHNKKIGHCRHPKTYQNKQQNNKENNGVANVYKSS